jgi:subtilisin-like proprotein convertase family protein
LAPAPRWLAALVPFALLGALAAPTRAQDYQLVELGSGGPIFDKHGNAVVEPTEKANPRADVSVPGEALPGRPAGRSQFRNPGMDWEVEPNNTSATATPIDPAGSVIRGAVFRITPAPADVDFFSFQAAAGDKVYAAVQTTSSAAAGNSTLRLLASDGTTVLEEDLDDGSLSATSSSIAGTVIPAPGTYYLQVLVTGTTNGGRLAPYDLFLHVRSGVPAPEVEPNNSTATATPLPASGWVSGSAIDTQPNGESDFFSVALAAGDTVFVSIDADPERDGVSWNARMGFGLFGSGAPSQILVVNDANAGTTPANPASEAFFMTVRDAGTYFAYVDLPAGTGSPNNTYQLSVTVIPQTPATSSCTTYSATGLPIVLPTGPADPPAVSTITIPGNPRIADINVSIELDHTFMADLDAVLVSPSGNTNGLFTDIGAATVGGPQTTMRLVFDDESAFPTSANFALSATWRAQPELNYRLSYFDGEDAGGNWTLQLRDDATGDGGNLTAWSIEVCEPEPPPACAPGFQPVVVYQSDFEADDGGFTHSGTLDEWERGLPAFGNITTCASGVNCWKTDLDNTYDASSNQTLLSPSIDLSGLSAPVIVRWSQRYRVETSSFDQFSVAAREVGNPTNAVTAFDWYYTLPTETFGGAPNNLSVTPTAGWGQYSAQVDSLAGLPLELAFNLTSDTTVQFDGWAIDDVSVTACEPGNPEISMSKTVGLTAGVCGVDETLTIEQGTPVTYCYTVTNTGGVALTSHTLVDDQLGTILENFPFVLNPGASAFVTVDDVVLDATTTNNATWTASDSDVTTACSAGGITITGASGSPYPSTAALAGASTTPDRVEVHLENVTHTFTEDIDALLVGPGGQTLVVMSDAGGGESILDVDLDLDDLAPAPLAEADPLESGAFRPADYTDQADAWPAPAPPGPYGRAEPTGSDTFTSVFGGLDPNGTWNLYVTDAFPTFDDGSIGNWCVSAIEELFEASATDSATVTVLIPDIAVDPASLSSFQAVDTQVVETLDITNNGDATLDWSIAEDDGFGGRVRTARVPGRQEPIRAHRRVPAPEAPALEAASESFGRSEATEKGRRFLPEPRLVPEGTVTITHSATQAIVIGNSVACNSGGLHTNNSYIRRFDLGAFGITGSFDVVEVSFGIEQATGAGGDQPVTVNLYTWDPVDPFTFANFSLIGTATGNVPDQAGTVATFPVTGTAPAGSTLVVELFTPNGQVDGNGLFVGSNPDGQTDPTFLAAADCGVPEPTDTAVIGFPGMHWVLNVTGQSGCDVDLPWVSVDPTSGATAPLATSTVDVTFDSTGLDLGGIYTGALCVESDDPDTPTVLVPLTLEVDSMPFIDGFESGDTSEWTATQP